MLESKTLSSATSVNLHRARSKNWKMSMEPRICEVKVPEFLPIIISRESSTNLLLSLTQSNAVVGSCISRLPKSDRSGIGVVVVSPPDTDRLCATV